MPRRQPQLTTPAQLNAVLRYAPQRQALAQAAREAREDHEASIAGAQSEARLNASAVANATPAVQGIYDRAQSTSSAARSQLAGVLQGLGPAASNFAASAAVTGAQGAEKTARERADAEGALQSQAMATKAAPAFARTLADNRLYAALNKIKSTQEGVAGQEGLATVTGQEAEAKEKAAAAATAKKEARGEREGAADRALRRQGLSDADRHHAEDLLYKETHPTGSGGSSASGYLTKDKQTAAASKIREIEGLVRGRYYGRVNRATALKLLATAVPAKQDYVKGKDGKIEYDEAGKPKTKSLPGRSAYSPDVLTQAALDSVYYSGSVTPDTLKKLHTHGYELSALELAGPHPRKQGR